jgi:hypothetical protein
MRDHLRSFKWSLITGDLLNGLLLQVVFYKWSFEWSLITSGIFLQVVLYKWSLMTIYKRPLVIRDHLKDTCNKRPFKRHL